MARVMAHTRSRSAPPCRQRPSRGDVHAPLRADFRAGAPSPRLLRIAIALSACAMLAACGSPAGKAPPPPAIPGARLIAAGIVRAVAPSADGAWVAWLDGCNVARGLNLPPGTSNCDLRVAPVDGGAGTRVASGVTSLPHGLLWSPSGPTLAVLSDYDYSAGAGTLLAWSNGAARELAREVTFHGFGPRGELGFVAGGKLSVLLPGEERPRAVAGAEGVASFEFSPGSFPDAATKKGVAAGDTPEIRLAARQAAAAGGRLLLVRPDLDRATAASPARVQEYRFSPTGSFLAFGTEAKGGVELHRLSVAKPQDVTLSRGAGRFSFASDGEALAWLAQTGPSEVGALVVAAPGRPPVQLAKDVGDFQWAAKARRLAWLQGYDPRVRSGVLGVGGPGVETRTFGRNVTDLDISADGRFVAFLQHTARGGYSVDLGLAALDGKAPPTVVATGVFGFAFSPDSKWLYYRTRCTRNGEACDIERVPATGLAKDGKPEPIAQAAKSFDFDARDPSRLLVGWQRMDRQALDVAVWQQGKLVRVAESVLPGGTRFLAPASKRLVFAAVDPARAGVFVAEP